MPRHIIIAVTSLAHEALIARGIGVSVFAAKLSPRRGIEWDTKLRSIGQH